MAKQHAPGFLKIVTDAMLCITDPSAWARWLRRSERMLVASRSELGIRSRNGWNSPRRRSTGVPRVTRLIMRRITYRSTNAAAMINRIRAGFTSA